jgi:hypothetical protein
MDSRYCLYAILPQTGKSTCSSISRLLGPYSLTRAEMQSGEQLTIENDLAEILKSTYAGSNSSTPHRFEASANACCAWTADGLRADTTMWTPFNASSRSDWEA